MYIELNKLYCMDNLELMKELPSNSIDLIYGDILYGTGRNFGDYQDLPADRKVIEEFYIPRIKEMHRLLKDTGSIYLQMDYRINHWIRIILDEIFGYENFKNEINRTIHTVKNNVKSSFVNSNDIILFYTKSNHYNFKPQYENKIAIATLKEYKYKDKEDLFRLARTRNYQTKGKSKVYLSDYKGRLVDNNWCSSLNDKELVNYKTQKPKKLLERIIKASSNKDDVIFDPFLGSGTTIVVAEELNRKWIGCDINPKSIEITNERLSKVQKRLF